MAVIGREVRIIFVLGEVGNVAEMKLAGGRLSWVTMDIDLGGLEVNHEITEQSFVPLEQVRLNSFLVKIATQLVILKLQPTSI